MFTYKSNVSKHTKTITKRKLWTTPFLLEITKSKEFHSTDLEIDFLIDSGAESNIIYIPNWKEIKILHPKLIPLKTTSKLATAQGSALTNCGKIQRFLIIRKQWNKTNS